VRALASIEHVGHQHRVVRCAQPDASAREDQPIPFHIVSDLDDAFVFENGLQRIKGLLLGDLSDAELCREQSCGFALVGLAVPERQIRGFVRRHGKGQAAQRGLHRVEAGGFGLEDQQTGIVGPVDPMPEALEGCDCFVLCRVERGRPQRLQSPLGERDRRKRGGTGSRAGCGLARRRAERQLTLSSSAARRNGHRIRRSTGWGRRRGCRFDLTRIDAALFGDALHQRLESHRLEEGDQRPVIGFVHAKIVDRHFERHPVIKRHKLL
jgi:hypothetical protein